MKFIALTFDYSIKKLEELGRSWSRNVYKEKEHIFEYSAASYASFVYYNPEKKLVLLTDDIELLRKNLLKYNINLKNVEFIDWSKELEIYKKDKYAFRPAIELVKYFKNSDDYIIKLDNDLICKGPIDFAHLTNEVLVWKKEGWVSNGNPLWGEILVAQKVLNDTNFWRYNIGVLGIPPMFWKYHNEYIDICNKMIDIDISSVTDVNSKIWHCCEQTAYNWILHKYKFDILETYDLFDHYFENKKDCINYSTKFLKK